MRHRCVVGIDPGKTGAMAILHRDNSVEAYHVPQAKVSGTKRAPNWTVWFEEWKHALANAEPDLIVIEEVSAMPGQGVTSMFNFGRAYGFPHCIAVAYNNDVPLSWNKAPIIFTRPAVWKAKLGMTGKHKDFCREMFRELFPSSTSLITQKLKGQAVADAALIAFFGRTYR